ncbi:MAG: phenylalanine--tRNA ligase subunit beta [Acidobacteria bacterium]|nr:phenylalanine--tRNA ligase subunit beta [Acidobacteriota bacterium]
MKVSYQWLQDFVNLDLSEVEVGGIAEALTRVGLAVEEVEELETDYIFDVEVTTNRPDCLNHLGIAREIAAHFGLQLKFPDFSPPPNGADQSTVLATSVTIENRTLCPRYAARVLSGLTIAESPGWLKARLEAVGQRPINNIVDITNYVLLEMGHPLHAFDYDKLKEHRIIVRVAEAGERLTTLDGVERELDSSMLVICDARGPVAMAGIMGGEESEISQDTHTLLLESAYFDSASVRKTAKNQGLRTEASFRFERGADPEIPVKALNRTCRLIQEIAGGVMAGPVIDEYPNPPARNSVQLRSPRITKVLGVEIDPEFVTNTLSRLEFVASQTEKNTWQVPSFRVDVGIEDDLVEEVARHYGYERIESTYPNAPSVGSFLATEGHDRLLTGTLEGLGFLEAFNYVFTNPSKETVFWTSGPSMTAISNPLSEEDTHLRVSLVPGLVEALRRNLNHGNKNVRLFELGKVFLPGTSDEGGGPQELWRLGLVATGAFYQPFWNTARDEFHFHHLKGIVEVLLDKLGREGKFQDVSDISFLHPGIAASVSVDGEMCGALGQLQPRLQDALKFLHPVFVAELLLEPLYRHPLPQPRYERLERLPSVQRDLSFIVDKEVEYAKMLSVVEELGIPDLRDIELIDLYQSPTLPQGKVSLAIRLTFASPEKTLTQEEVNRSTEEIASLLEKTFSTETRS